MKRIKSINRINRTGRPRKHLSNQSSNWSNDQPSNQPIKRTNSRFSLLLIRPEIARLCIQELTWPVLRSVRRFLQSSSAIQTIHEDMHLTIIFRLIPTGIWAVDWLIDVTFSAHRHLFLFHEKITQCVMLTGRQDVHVTVSGISFATGLSHIETLRCSGHDFEAKRKHLLNYQSDKIRSVDLRFCKAVQTISSILPFILHCFIPWTLPAEIEQFGSTNFKFKNLKFLPIRSNRNWVTVGGKECGWAFDKWAGWAEKTSMKGSGVLGSDHLRVLARLLYSLTQPVLGQTKWIITNVIYLLIFFRREKRVLFETTFRLLSVDFPAAIFDRD